ncbi:DUF4132 domain-containing protein [Streptomyces sp. enrichment culture]|uniref:DUF4132 domain-containing protein n=1 Tax=Streptomyces sp. enrichment culture TaxID=1795815 RepID=UPI003F54353F
MTPAERLMRALTDPEYEIPDRYGDLALVSDEELGTLMPAAYAVRAGSPHGMTATRLAVQSAGEKRSPRYTPDACRRMFEALVAGTETREWADLALGVGSLARCTGPLPDLAGPARFLVGHALREDYADGRPLAMLTVGVLAGGEELRTVVRLLSNAGDPLAEDELAVLTGLAPGELALLAETDRHRPVTAPPPLPDAWRRIAGLPAYTGFARRALETAVDRTDAIRGGSVPYRSDRAFTGREVAALGRALRVALVRDERWLPGLLDRLLPGIAVAPTTAKTLPSQALLYEITRAAQEWPTPELVTALRTVRRVVRNAGVPNQLDKVFKKIDAALADRTDVALRLPALGFAPDGVLRREAGQYTAVVTVADGAELGWEKDGRRLRGVPAAVRREQGGTLKELRELVKRVDAHLATLVRALEAGLSSDVRHPYGRWRTDLAGHPLARSVVRRLIWEVEVAPGTWQAVLPETGDLPEAPEDAAVRLWHPLRCEPDAVRAWRDLLTEARVRQPFKQAFREIYVLTPAEEETRVHSHRFAAHLVRHPRMRALFRARGWTSGHPWHPGDEDEAERVLGGGEWRACFRYVQAEWTAEERLASTDRVRFERRTRDGWREAPLAEVPALVFSEAMRDVDLFVGVTSIAADPDWADGGAGRAYWERAAFAELPGSALARREVLERIVPRLKIADRCTLDGRFLVVRGDLRTYKIHIWSANILMEPDDSYLCIVPARRVQERKVFLPFEDERLGVILSKAFLLAADAEITDPAILRQIRRAG